MALGLICVGVGVAMLLLGYAGVVDFHLNMGTVFEARLGNAGPGLVLTIIGLAYSWLAATGFKIEFNMREDGWDFVGHSGRTRRA